MDFQGKQMSTVIYEMQNKSVKISTFFYGQTVIKIITVYGLYILILAPQTKNKHSA